MKRYPLIKSLFLCCTLLVASSAWAVVEYHDFQKPEQEAAYQSLIHELRCLVCQNQTIADSNADLAKDLRRQVYEMLQKGQDKQQIVAFMTDRYGDFVMYKPSFTAKTWLLWLGPVLFLLVGLLGVVLVIHRKTTTEQPALNDDQQARLRALIEKGDED